MPEAIDFEYGSVWGPFPCAFGAPFIGIVGLGMLFLGIFSVTTVTSTPSWELVAAIPVLSGFGLWFLIWAVVAFRTRHAFVTKYSVSDTGIEATPRDGLARLIRWPEFNKVVIRRFFWTIELYSPNLALPAVITNADADPAKARYNEAMKLILGKIGHLAEIKLV